MPELLKRIGTWAYRLVPVVSLVLASIALTRSVQTGRLLKQAGGLLELMSANLTTRYIGQFPDFMPDIVKTLEEANSTISIASDFPGYAMYSDHSDYVKYTGAIGTKLTKPVQVKMVVLNEGERERLSRFQFKDTRIEDLKDPNNSHLQNFLRWTGRKSQDIRTVDDFVRTLTGAQKRAMWEDF